MPCKNYQPQRCGTCRSFDRETYRGMGKKVCYELQRDANGQKVAVQVSENKKACNKFRIAKKVGRAV